MFLFGMSFSCLLGFGSLRLLLLLLLFRLLLVSSHVQTHEVELVSREIPSYFFLSGVCYVNIISLLNFGWLD